MGGQVVDESLVALGYDTQMVGTAMVETAVPIRRYSQVLLQSAWNVLTEQEFHHRMQRYPLQMRRRAMARRRIALWNMKRAEEVICLTHSVAALLLESTGIEARVVPVSCPLPETDDDFVGEVPVREEQVLVPGTLTWYKEPLEALELVARSDRLLPNVTVRFLGRDDGSGCWPAVKRRANQLGIRAERSVASRTEMRQLYRESAMTVLPSSLESLGFGLAEALLYAPARVVASPIPSHREVAHRLGVEPQWIGSGQGSGAVGPFPDKGTIENEWHALARALRLSVV